MLQGCIGSATSGTGSNLLDAVLYPCFKASATFTSNGTGTAATSVISAIESHASYTVTQDILNGGVESIDTFDFASSGLFSSLRGLFSHAILRAYPTMVFAPKDKSTDSYLLLQHAVISRCGNPKFGDFQCNSAMAIAKVLKICGVKGEYCFVFLFCCIALHCIASVCVWSVYIIGGE